MPNVADTGLESDKDFDFGDDDNVPPQSYQSPVTLLPVNVLVPEEGTFCLPVVTTQTRLLELMSVIRAGAIVLQLPATGDYNIDVLKAIESLNECGALPMSCEDIADCIDETPVVEAITNIILNNQTVINAIYQTVNESGFGNPNHINSETATPNDMMPSGLSDEPVKELENCNLDKLWGGIREGIVERLDDNTRSFLENLVVLADNQERINAIVGAIPFMGDIALAVLENLAQIAPDMKNLFEAYSSVTHKDEIACHLFDIVCAECRYPTFKEVMDYYSSNGLNDVGDWADITLKIVVDAVTLSAESAAQVFYHTFMTWQLWVLYAGGLFNGENGTPALIRMATLGEDNPSDNWLQLCDGCITSFQIWTWDFRTQGQGSFYLDPTVDGNPSDEGIWQEGSGWRLTGSSGQRLEVAFPHNPAWEIRAIGLLTSGNTITARSLLRRPTLGSTASAVATNLSNGTGEYNHCADGIASATGCAEMAIAFQVAATTPATFFQKIAIIYNAGHAPEGAQPTNDVTICS